MNIMHFFSAFNSDTCCVHIVKARKDENKLFLWVAGGGGEERESFTAVR